MPAVLVSFILQKVRFVGIEKSRLARLAVLRNVCYLTRLLLIYIINCISLGHHLPSHQENVEKVVLIALKKLEILLVQFFVQCPFP